MLASLKTLNYLNIVPKATQKFLSQLSFFALLSARIQLVLFVIPSREYRYTSRNTISLFYLTSVFVLYPRMMNDYD
jgi:hypothetical protein